MRLLLLLIALSLPPLALAQEYQFVKYRVADGLPTNAIKSITQDSLGFIWIATDEGLARFDGTHFTTYKEALHSQYAKAFGKDAAGNIYLVGDLDLIRVDNRVDTVVFHSIRQGARNPSDSTLWYPKAIYLNDKNEIWIAEPQSVTLIKDSTMKRFEFGKEDLTPQFIISFSFFMDQQNDFYCTSYFGRVYRLNRTSMKFEFVSNFPTDVNRVQVIGDKLWIVSEEGIYRSDLLKDGGFGKPKSIFKVKGATCVQELPQGNIFVGTTSDNQYILNAADFFPSVLPYPIHDVSSVFLTKDNDLWIASSDGLVLLQENLFRAITSGEQSTFIESIAEDSIHQVIYFTTAPNLYRSKVVNGVPSKPALLLSIPRGYFQSAQCNRAGLWATNRYQVDLIRDDQIVRRWDFENEGRFIFDLFIDSHDNVWLSQDGNPGVKCITRDMQVRRYPVHEGSPSGVAVVRENGEDILAGAVGYGSYLFRKANGDSVFRNISLPIHFPLKSDLSIADMAISDGVVWLASSEGLLRYDFKTISKVVLGNFNPDFAVKTIEKFPEGEIMFSNPMGVVRYNSRTGEWWLYTEGNGLPSNNISARGILKASENRVLVGTSLGLAIGKGIINLHQKSVSPLVAEALVNGAPMSLKQDLHIAYGSFLTLILSPNIYPKNKVIIEFKMTGTHKDWRELTGSELSVSEQESGIHEIEIRAKKTGGYDWSEITKFSFTVDKPFWRKSWFIASVMLGVLLIIWGSYQAARSANQRRRRELERLVREITEKSDEIQVQSEELTESNVALQNLNIQIAEQGEKISAQARELGERNRVIHELNDHLQEEVVRKSQDLLEANEELVKHNNELLQFSYTVSHNLRGPVARILGMNNLIALSKDASEKEYYLNLLNKVSLDLDTVLKDLNLIIDTRNAVFKVRERIEWEEEWNKCVSLLKDYILPEFEIEADFKNEPYVYSIRATIQNVFYNLLSNAIKYRSPDRRLKISIKSFSKDGYVGIRVTDNGLGIDLESHRNSVFKLYKRFHSHVAGKGLGLYLMKTQTEVLKGKIELESKLNVGTTFTILLPGPDDIQNQMFFENECAQLNYDAQTNCIIIHWKRNITSKEYRETFETVVQTIKTYHSPAWIADVRMQGSVSEEDQFWFINYILPEAARSGLKRHGVIGLKDPIRHDYYKRVAEKAQELDLELRLFDTVEEAKAWMQKIFLL